MTRAGSGWEERRLYLWETTGPSGFKLRSIYPTSSVHFSRLKGRGRRMQQSVPSSEAVKTSKHWLPYYDHIYDMMNLCFKQKNIKKSTYLKMVRLVILVTIQSCTRVHLLLEVVIACMYVLCPDPSKPGYNSRAQNSACFWMIRLWDSLSHTSCRHLWLTALPAPCSALQNGDGARQVVSRACYHCTCRFRGRV